MNRAVRTAALLLLASCGGPPPPPPIPALERAPVAPPPASPAEAWTREAGTLLRGPVPVRLPHLGMRVAVLEDAGDSLRVRCVVCPGAPEGWTERTRVVWVAYSPAQARQHGLADFVLAIREAARRRDVAALEGGMSRDFIYSLAGREGARAAVQDLAGPRAADLARIPAILDRGLAAVPQTPVWAAPPEYATVRGYSDLRTGFVRGPDGWEWTFLMRTGPGAP
jgi:hypothetical protein